MKRSGNGISGAPQCGSNPIRPEWRPARRSPEAALRMNDECIRPIPLPEDLRTPEALYLETHVHSPALAVPEYEVSGLGNATTHPKSCNVRGIGLTGRAESSTD